MSQLDLHNIRVDLVQQVFFYMNVLKEFVIIIDQMRTEGVKFCFKFSLFLH